MYLAVPPQPDCVSAWREAVRKVDAQPGHEAQNVLLAIADPTAGAALTDPRVNAVNDFLLAHEKSIGTISNTIFPEALYRRYGAPDFFERFEKKVLPSVRRNERWSGYYFERMINWPGSPMDNPLWDIVKRMRDPSVKARNKFELALFDPARDVDRSPYGGQCLSFLSFKLSSGAPSTLSLTAFYRNHYYVEKLLGNLVGLGHLMSFVAKEAGLAVGSLMILSSHATVDLPKSCAAGGSTRRDLASLLDQVDRLAPTMA